jgi:hypothetical protein
VLLARGPVETLNVPHTCRSVQSRRDLLVGAIESSGIVLLHHSRRGVAEPERDEDGFAPASNIIVAPVCDLEEDEAARAVVFGILAEMERK